MSLKTSSATSDSGLVKAHLRWKDGRSFAPRIQVLSVVSRYLYRTHGEHAYELCQKGSAVVDPDGRRISRIFLRRTPLLASLKGLPSEPTPRSYATKAPVFKERINCPNGKVAHIYAFNGISKEELWAINAVRKTALFGSKSRQV